MIKQRFWDIKEHAEAITASDYYEIKGKLSIFGISDLLCPDPVTDLWNLWKHHKILFSNV